MTENIGILGSVWKKAQADEEAWGRGYLNTYFEEQKQLVYAEKMGLQRTGTDWSPYQIDLEGKTILDIGGGACSLLLKCENFKGKVIDPLSFPAWVLDRYKEAGVAFEQIKGEDITEAGWDEVWLYNVLTHTDNPQKVVENAKAAGTLIRIFDWIEGPVDDMHPHTLTSEQLNQWLDGQGTVENLPNSGKSYYGMFPTETDNMIHFVMTSEELIYPYYLAIMSAVKTQKVDKIILWGFGEPTGVYYQILKDQIEFRSMTRPEFPAVTDESSIPWLEHSNELLKIEVVTKCGGISLDLDTFCLQDISYMLCNTDKELVLANEVENGVQDLPFFNDAIFMAKRNSAVMRSICEEAHRTSCLPELGRGSIALALNHIGIQQIEKVDVIYYGILGGGGITRIVDRLAQEDKELAPQSKVLHLFANDSPFFYNLTEEFVRDSDILFARTVRNVLDESEWMPTLKPKAAIVSSPKQAPASIAMRFHLLGIPHLATNKGEAIACAYSQKALKMATMLKNLGHTVYFYGVEESQVECDEFIQVSTQAVIKEAYGGYDSKKEQYKHDINDVAYRTFNFNTIPAIQERMHGDDFLLIPFSPTGYRSIIETLHTPHTNNPNKLHLMVEMGVGYGDITPDKTYRVFESYAHMHALYGTYNTVDGRPYDAVIPNYFDPKDFHYSEEKADFYLYLGRIIKRKGVAIAIRVAELLGEKLVIAGQLGKERNSGIDLNHPNVDFIGFADWEKRRQLLSDAKAMFLPTQYLEPFGGTVIEAGLSGTPVITSDWGAFTEIVDHGKTGFRCRTMDHYVWAAKNITKIKPIDCHRWAIDNFSLERVQYMYQEYFEMLYRMKTDPDGQGWGKIYPDRMQLDWMVKRREYGN